MKKGLAAAFMFAGTVIVGVTATVPAGGNSFQDATSITQCGQALSRPGRYIVAQDIQCGPTDTFGISINASGIHLILAGGLNSTPPGVPGIVSSGEVSDIVITGGGHIAGGPIGIGISGDNIKISGLTVSGFCAPGPSCGVGIQVQGKHVSIIGNTISATYYAIMGGMSGGRIVKNTISLPPDGNGISVSGSANLIRDNTISGIGGAGLVVDSHTLVKDNSVTGMQYGIELASDGNLVLHNAVTGDFYGIFVQSGASSNLILRNSATGNQTDLFDSNGPPCVNEWRFNTFSSSGGAMACIH